MTLVLILGIFGAGLIWLIAIAVIGTLLEARRNKRQPFPPIRGRGK